MKNSFRRLALTAVALSAFSNSALAQDATGARPPANDPVVAGTLPTSSFGIDIPPQTFPTSPRETDARRWDLDDIENVRPIPVPRPREVGTSSINIGPISVREGDRDRLRPGCRWTVRDETLQRRCRW